MASYQVAAGQHSQHDNTLTASTVDSVTFTDSAQAVEIITDGTAKVYVTVDGSTPTVSGSNTYLIPAAVSALTLAPQTESGVTVKLISAGTPVYSVSIAR